MLTRNINIRSLTLFCLPSIMSGVLAISAMFYSGCATGPKFENAEQQDSARIVGIGVQKKGTEENGNSEVRMTRIDGLAVDFYASSIRPSWGFPKTSLYLAPGKHTLTLAISNIETVNAPGEASIAGVISSGATPTITATFLTNHIYRLSANLSEDEIRVVLWDETGAGAYPSAVESWMFNANSSYSNTAR